MQVLFCYIARLVILLLESDESSSVTGQCIVSDHGMCL